MHPHVDLAGSAGIAGAAQADLEPLVAKVEQHLGALADSLHVRNIPEIEQQAQALHRALARAVEGFMLVARHGGVPEPMRRRLSRASSRSGDSIDARHRQFRESLQGGAKREHEACVPAWGAKQHPDVSKPATLLGLAHQSALIGQPPWPH